MSVGVGVFIVSPINRILIGKRGPESKRHPGCWALPGGMVEPGETITETVIREVREETGLIININHNNHNCEYNDCIIGVSDHRPREEHYTFWCIAYHFSGIPEVLEPGKCECWKWITPEAVFEEIQQTPEQSYWTPQRAWRKMLTPYGFFQGT